MMAPQAHAADVNGELAILHELRQRGLHQQRRGGAKDGAFMAEGFDEGPWHNDEAEPDDR